MVRAFRASCTSGSSILFCDEGSRPGDRPGARRRARDRPRSRRRARRALAPGRGRGLRAAAARAGRRHGRARALRGLRPGFSDVQRIQLESPIPIPAVFLQWDREAGAIQRLLAAGVRHRAVRWPGSGSRSSSRHCSDTRRLGSPVSQENKHAREYQCTGQHGTSPRKRGHRWRRVPQRKHDVVHRVPGPREG